MKDGKEETDQNRYLQWRDARRAFARLMQSRVFHALKMKFEAWLTRFSDLEGA